MRARKLAALLITLIAVAGVLTAILPRVRAHRDMMRSDMSKKMADRIGKAKPGAIIRFYSGRVVCVYVAIGNFDGGNVTYYSQGGSRESLSISQVAWNVADVINQEEPGYDGLAWPFLRGEGLPELPRQ